MKMTEHDSVAEFVKFRIQQLAENDYREARIQEQKPVTVRLPAGYIALIDRLAQDLELSRQAFMFEVISEALDECIRALVQSAPEDRAMHLYRDLTDLKHGEGTADGEDYVNE